MIKKLRNRIFVSVAFAGLIYLGFMIYFNFDKVLSSFENFDWILLPILLLLSLANYFTRFLKWQYYLKVINVKVPLIDSLSVFMSGLIMSVTPGKLGELLKAYLVKQINNTPISKTAPIIFAERATDFLSLTILAIFGAYYFNYGTNVVIVIAIFIVLGIIIASNRKLSEMLLAFLLKVKFLKKHIVKIYNAYESSFKLFGFFPLISMTLLSVISWGFECLGFYFILTHFEPRIDIIWAFFSYSFSTVVGAVSMLPGGLGITEASLTLMNIKQGLSSSNAFASTFIVRVVTLWFAVLIGAISVLYYQKRFGSMLIDLNK